MRGALRIFVGHVFTGCGKSQRGAGFCSTATLGYVVFPTLSKDAQPRMAVLPDFFRSLFSRGLEHFHRMGLEPMAIRVLPVARPSGELLGSSRRLPESGRYTHNRHTNREGLYFI